MYVVQELVLGLFLEKITVIGVVFRVILVMELVSPARSGDIV